MVSSTTATHSGALPIADATVRTNAASTSKSVSVSILASLAQTAPNPGQERRHATIAPRREHSPGRAPRASCGRLFAGTYANNAPVVVAALVDPFAGHAAVGLFQVGPVLVRPVLTPERHGAGARDGRLGEGSILRGEQRTEFSAGRMEAVPGAE